MASFGLSGPPSKLCAVQVWPASVERQSLVGVTNQMIRAPIVCPVQREGTRIGVGRQSAPVLAVGRV